MIMNKRKNAVFLLILLLLAGCAPRETLSVRQSGALNDVEISYENKGLLPPPVSTYRLTAGDVLRLEATPRQINSLRFLIERGDSLRISFNFEDSTYHIMAGDRISIFLQRNSPLNRETTVRMDGRITLPSIGEVMAEGKTPLELKKILTREFLKKIRDVSISVSVLQSNMTPFTQMSGEYMVLPDGTISLPVLGVYKVQGMALDSLAEKIEQSVQKKFHNHFHVSVAAQNLAINHLQIYDKVLTITPAGDFILPHIGNIMAKGKTLVQVQDEIENRLKSYYYNPIDVSLGLISSTNNSVYVSGEVKFPGIYPLIADMTSLKALSLAGGVTPKGNLDEVVLIHYTGPDSVTVYKTSLDEVIDNASALHDLSLSPQDIVFVPKTGVAEANQFIQQYITRMLPFTANITYNINNIQ